MLGDKNVLLFNLFASCCIFLPKGRVENMGTFDELASSGKEFAMLLTALQDGKDKDSESVGSGVVSYFILHCSFIFIILKSFSSTSYEKLRPNVKLALSQKIKFFSVTAIDLYIFCKNIYF